jgi:HlyD family secretion protein
MSRRKIILGAVVLVAAAGWLTYQFVLAPRDPDGGSVVRVSGNVELTDVEMAFKIPGLVAERPVDEGYDVRKGQLVAKLETQDLRADLDMREAELLAAQWASTELERGSREQEKVAAKAVMDKVEASLKALQTSSPRQIFESARAKAALRAAEREKERAAEDWTRTQKTQEFNPAAISREQYDQTKATYEVALARWEEAQEQLNLTREVARREQIEEAQKALDQATAQWELVKEGPREEDKKQAKAKVQQAEAAKRLAELRLNEYAVVRAPFDGVVLAKHAEPGEYVAAGTPVVTVGDMDHVWVRAYVEETDLKRVKYGQRARVTTDGDPDGVYEGYVSFIASDAEFTPKNVQTPKERVKLVYRIKIDVFKNPGHELKRGMPADVEILLGEMAEGVPAKPVSKPG